MLLFITKFAARFAPVPFCRSIDWVLFSENKQLNVTANNYQGIIINKILILRIKKSEMSLNTQCTADHKFPTNTFVSHYMRLLTSEVV